MSRPAFGPACAFLLRTSFVNLARHQARRLRRPRYLVPAVLFVLYFGFILAGQNATFELGFDRLGRTGAAGAAEPAIAIAVAAAFVLPWLLGKPRPRLAFTEAEVHFLFGAPATQRHVVQYRLVKLLLQSLVPALLLSLFLARAAPGPAPALAAALWIAFATLELHGVGASFVRSWLHERATGLRLRTVQVAGLGAIVAGTIGVASDPRLSSAPMRWVLWPAKALVRAGLAARPDELLAAFSAALLVLGVHYAWVLAAATRFEDAAVEAAERAARLRERVRSGGTAAIVAGGRSRSVPFRLAATARPEIAMAWKGLIGITRSRVVRLVAILMPLALGGAFAMSILAPSGEAMRLGEAGGIFATILLVVLFMGPSFTGGGLAGDLGRLDFLRALPLSGARVVLGQALAPTILLMALWMVLAPVASFLFPAPLGALERSCLALGLMFVGPPLLLLAVLLQAAFVVALPGWTGAGSGPLAIGRMMLAYVVHLVGMPILSVPAALPAAALVAFGRGIAGWAAVPVAAVAAAAVLVAEIAIALLVVGRIFERLDPAEL